MPKVSPRTSSPIITGSSQKSENDLLSFLTRFERYAQDFAGVLLLAISLMTVVGLFFPDWAGGLLDWWAGFLRLWFGWGSLWFVLACGFLGIWTLRRRGTAERIGFRFWARLFALEAAAFSSIALLTLMGGPDLERAELGLDGGRVGWGLVEILNIVFNPFGLYSRFIIMTLVVLVFILGLLIGIGGISVLRRWAATASVGGRGSFIDDEPVVSEAPLQTSPSNDSAPARRRLVLPPQFRKSFRIDSEEKGLSELPPRDARLPSLDLLVNEQFNRPDERNINLTAGLIEKTLAEFGIPAKVVGFRVGPTVTQFAVEPGYLEKETVNSENGETARQKIRVAQIASLGRDLALALAAERLRIQAPVPGRPYVGIEVPNVRSTIVRLRPIVESEQFYKFNSPLSIALGRDVSGMPYVADLSRMPHLLIAGTTGSGKSVCIAAITTCLVMNNTPEDMRLVMIDPKMVELVRFNGLPHLYGKVETELDRILGVLHWTVAEMDRRYKVLEASRSRNIDSYNRKIRRRKGERTLPHIVVLIDELADLMMSAPDQTEHNLVRLAQMARATGIHLVVATQRPGTEVVTGLIKANFPARIAFTVASSIDSRVILDSGGAESLLGHGDMLFLPPDVSSPIRLQGVMVSDQEVERVITFWQKNWVEPQSAKEGAPPWEETIAQEMMLADRDDLVERALEIVKQSQHASASLLQRRLHIGYPRAARLIDELESLGVIGPAVSGGRERDVLIDPEGGDGGESHAF
jgi:DNA segregation ATPase FtsK/SpoIIIE, S-DNA-T family